MDNVDALATAITGAVRAADAISVERCFGFCSDGSAMTALLAVAPMEDLCSRGASHPGRSRYGSA